MHFNNIVIECLEYALPDEIWTSSYIEDLLTSVYERLRLPKGRLELMTGIIERRFFPKNTKPSQAAALAGKKALAKTRICSESIDLLIHTGVCRDRMEPATAAYVHEQLSLGPGVQIMDLSNACLGFMNAIVLASGLIQSGQIRSAMIVSGENGRPLMEHTVQTLLSEPLNRTTIKPYFANLTIGAGAVAAILTHSSNVQSPALHLNGACIQTLSQSSRLCEGSAVGDHAFTMQTDAEQLLKAGITLAKTTWDQFKSLMKWTEQSLDWLVCHQVGKQHHKQLYEALNLPIHKDFSTYPLLGNMGSVSWPLTLAKLMETQKVALNQKLAVLGIGSGLTCGILALTHR